MKITRNGIEYELTEDEVFVAWREGQRLADIEELGYWLDALVEDGEITKEDADKVNIEEYVDEYRMKLDSYEYVNELTNSHAFNFVREEII